MELRKLAIPVAVFTLILAVQTARAENGSKETAIRTLIEITDTISMVKQAVEHVLPTIWRWVKKTNPAIPDHVVSVLDEELIQAVDESTPEFRKGLAAIYDEYFTETEINDLLVFYRTETGQKLVALTPQLLAEAVSFGKQWRRDVLVPLAKRRITERLRKEGYEL